jgi:hypothetical protein
MDASELLSQITIPTPCPMDWNLMRGDDRVRLCDSCSKDVYNLSAMTANEVVDLVHRYGGESFCGRFFKRPDGTLVTAECPQLEPSRPTRRLQFHLGTIMKLVAMVAVALGFIRMLPETEPPPTQPPTTPEPPGTPSASSHGNEIFVGKVAPLP